MTITPIETTHSNQPSLSGNAGFLRTSSAHDAQAFAQVLQGFESESESIVVDSLQNDTGNELGEESSSDESIRSDEASTVEDEVVEEQDSEQSNQSTNTNTNQDSDGDETGQTNNATNPDDSSSIELNHVDQAQSADPSTTQTTTDPTNPQVVQSSNNALVQEPSLANDSSLRLLENQSEQAKLSIKGLVKSKIQSAGTDLTSIAVETKLGKQHDAGRPVPIDPTGTTGPTRIDKQSDQPPTNDALSSTPPQSDRQLDENQLNHVIGNASKGAEAQGAHQTSRPTNTQSTTEPTDARRDQTAVDVNSSKTLRADASAVVAAGTSRESLNERVFANTNSTQIADGNRAQAITSRAVSGVEASDLGQLKGETHSESSVKNIRQAELRGESNRAGVLAQVQRGLASLLRSGKNEMTLKLTPEHLGEIRIRVQTEGLELAVRFETSSEEATELLQGQLKDLGNQLRAKGFNIDRISLSDDSTQSSDSSQSSAGNGSDSNNTESNAEQHRSSQDQSSNQQHDELQSLGFDELDAGLDADSIWTDIGLDAIA